MRVETALRRYLLQQTAVTSLVQGRVWKYHVGERLDQTGRAGVLVRTAPGFAAPDRVQTVRFPRILIDAIADPTRDENGLIAGDNATDRAYALAETIIPLLTYPNLRGVEIGAAGDRPGVVIVSSQMYAEPRSIAAADYHTIAESRKAGDTITVRVEYAMEVVGG